MNSHPTATAPNDDNDTSPNPTSNRRPQHMIKQAATPMIGAINGAISSDGTTPQALLEQVREAPVMTGLNLAEQVSTRQPYDWDRPCAAGFDTRLQ